MPQFAKILPNTWPTNLDRPSSSTAIQARTQLNLPIDRPIVASGHQPIVFHPGIAAKLIALDHWSKKTGAAPVWIVPDQDVVDPALIRVPKQSKDSIVVEHFRLGGEPIQSSPVASLPPIAINPDLPDKLDPLGQWLMGYEHESSLARQFASATIGMLCDHLDLEEPTLIYASELLALDASVAFVDAMMADPKAAIESYNESVRQFPDAGVRELSITDTHIELPLWRLEGNARLPVFVEQNQSELGRTNLIPRGLLMTAIMRSFVSDLFIHGTGGYDYDQITEHWMNDWKSTALAPITAATATMTLGFNLPESESPDRAAWIAHHARHTPSMLGDDAAAKHKAELVTEIADSDSKAAKSQLFAQLHKLLDQTNADHAEAIKRFDQASKLAQQSRQTLEIANDRTWAFPLYTDQQLQLLKDQVIQALDASD